MTDAAEAILAQISQDTHAPSAGRSAANEIPVTRIEPRGGRLGVDWRELWRFRDLLYFLTWRDIKIRYKQTVLGASWAILQPVLTMLVFSLFFGRLAGMDHKTGGIPYPIYVFAALLPWTFFANALTNCGNSLVGSYTLITKVYFPRLIIPAGAVLAGLVDFGLSLVVLIGMMLFYRIQANAEFLLLPIIVSGVVMAAVGVGSLLAALTVNYRDFRYVVPFLTQIWMFVTPVIYPSTIVPERWRWLFALNPLAGLIDAFRCAFLGKPIAVGQFAISFAASIAFLALGTVYFRSMERQFADVI